MARMPYDFIHSVDHASVRGPWARWPRLRGRGARGDLRAAATGAARAQTGRGKAPRQRLPRARDEPRAAFGSGPAGPGVAVESEAPRLHCARDREELARTSAPKLRANAT